ncbi:hypothetical protein JOC33_003462 [Thalassobacillus pellis]|nr:DUF6884 domain-containing protein [Thalassobacillus pellis]MBM7554524.1 hypothetical protein [Thalassobacillus pellis]
MEQCDYDAWFILSAKYGLLEPDTVIEPYDVSVNQLHTSARKTWSHSVLAQVMAFPTPISRIDFYAGRPYREQLMHDLELRGIPCQTPLQGKGIGEQLRYYALHTQDFHP